MQNVRVKLLLWLLLAGMCVAATLVWYEVFRAQQQVLTVSFLDVGQGDAVLIQSPTGRRMLIDGGPNGAVLHELSKVLPWYSRRIDIVLATHPDADHIGGLIDVLQRYAVMHIIDNGISHDTPAVESFLRGVSHETAAVHTATRGDSIDLGGGVVVEVLFPDRVRTETETNAASIVARVVYGAHSFLLTGDAPKSIENYLARVQQSALQSTVLKVGHHGSNTSSSKTFVGFVAPQYAVYSRGCENRYGHPHAEVIEVFDVLEVETFDTCTDGAVTFTTDGNVLTVQ